MLQLRLVSSLALTAENWEPCVHITLRANGSVQAKAARASLLDLPLYRKNRCTAYLPLTSIIIHRVQWPYKSVRERDACNIEFVKKEHCRDLRNDGRYIYTYIPTEQPLT